MDRRDPYKPSPECLKIFVTEPFVEIKSWTSVTIKEALISLTIINSEIVMPLF